MLLVFCFVFIFSSFFTLIFRCNSQRDCEIAALSEDFGGDPCPSTNKYLEVYYGCQPGKNKPPNTTLHKNAVLRIRICRIHMFLGLPDPDPLVRGPDPDPSIIKQKLLEKP
jgi:hypothetical protein